MIITNTSHLDHALTPDHLAWIACEFKDRAEFFVDTRELPEHLPALPCALYGPTMGDEVIGESEARYDFRGGRPYCSRLTDKPLRPSRQITVIGGPDESGACVLFTAFGGPCAPQEPGDLSVRDPEESRLFWAVHALANPSTRTVCPRCNHGWHLHEDGYCGWRGGIGDEDFCLCIENPEPWTR